MSRSSLSLIRVASVAILAVAMSASTAAMAIGQSPSALSASLPPQSPVPATLTVEGAWARVSPMVDRAGAAYMVIRNSGTADDALVAVSTSAAAVVELHETVPAASGDMMVMQPVASIPVPAGGMVELKPGSYHMMLIDLTAPLVAGTPIEFTLTFQGGSVLTVPVEVRSDAPMGSPAPMGSTMPMGSTPPMGSAAP